MIASLILVLLLAFAGAVVSSPAVTTAVAALTAVACGLAGLYRAARRRGRARLAWVTLGVGALSWGLGGGVPDGAGHFVLVAAAALSWFALPAMRRSWAGRVRELVDGLLIALSLLTLAWIYVLAPMVPSGSAHPLADVALGTVALMILGSGRRGSAAVRIRCLIASGLLLVALAGLLAAVVDQTGPAGYAAAIGRAGIGPAVPGALAFVAFSLIGYAAVRAPAERDKPGSSLRSAESADDVRRPLADVVPYVAVVVALVAVTVFYASGGRITDVATWCRIASIGLIIARQVLLMAENRGLTRRLETRVAERVADLQARQQRFRALIEQSSDSLAILEADSTVRYQSESIERIFGHPASALVGKRFVALAGRRVGARVEAGIHEVLGQAGATTVFEIMLRHGDGRFRMAEMTITNLIDDPYVGGLVFNTRDVSDARELQAQLRNEAYHDALTGLGNRALFRERLAAAFAGRASTEEVAVLFLDLDGFKEVNDSLGHVAGDHLLVQVAERLTGCVPDPHTVVRLGGDEFAVIVEAEAARTVAERVAEQILAALDEPFLVDERNLHVAAGVGVACAADATDIEQLQRNADLAMYRAKDAGGGGYATYDPEMHNALVHRLELAEDLRLALERDELVLHYQPTVDMRTGEITGFEALVRWHHPVRGMVSPLDFIGAAESTGLIVPLGRWVLAEACRQAVEWGAGRSRRLKMAVNVSVRQFDDGDLAETVAEVLAATGMPADQLCLEMTESVLLTDTDENLARMLRLKSLGVLLAMDDFGTGYSSLAYLRRFPMDVLKVDRSFVDRLGGESEDEALVRTIIRLGQRFGMQTVAEGIEDAKQLEILRDMGCDFAQGFYLSRPVPAAQAGLLLQNGIPVAA